MGSGLIRGQIRAIFLGVSCVRELVSRLVGRAGRLSVGKTGGTLFRWRSFYRLVLLLAVGLLLSL